MGEDKVFFLFLLIPLLFGGLLVLFARYNRRAVSKTGWGRVVAGNSLLLLFLLSLLFVGGEAYYRFFYDSTDALSYTKASRRWYQRYYHQNVAECRDNIEYYATPPLGKRRLTFVGDSFTAGHGVKDIENRFANHIRRAHPDWEIHVMARPGYDTSHELKLMEECFKGGYQANEVVLVYCLNDVSDLMPKGIENLKRIFADADNNGWLRRNSYLVNTLYHHFKAARDPYMKDYYHFVSEAYQGPMWEEQKRRLLAFRNLVQSHGAHLSVVTFPFLQDTGPNYAFRSAHAEIDRFWHEAGVPNLDLLSVYKDLPPAKITVNRFDPHPNEYAHQLAATAIDNFLRDRLKPESVRPPARSAKPGSGTL